ADPATPGLARRDRRGKSESQGRRPAALPLRLEKRRVYPRLPHLRLPRTAQPWRRRRLVGRRLSDRQAKERTLVLVDPGAGRGAALGGMAGAKAVATGVVPTPDWRV